MRPGTVEPNGTTVLALRHERGLTQEELARKVGCSKRTIENIEDGTPVLIRTLSELAEALEVPIRELMRSKTGELATTVASRPRLGTAPSCPSLLVGRDDDLRAIIAKLRHAVASESSERKLLMVRGWPGVGKTSIARAVAHHKEIVDLFPNGVLWVSLGRQPALELELFTWGRVLETSMLANDLGLAGMSSVIAGLLLERRILLIIDDAWEVQHVTPFLVGGRHSATLITTRITSVAESLSSSPDDIHPLEILSESAGLKLLETLAPEVAAKHRKQCRELVKELEGLPLALQVAGRLLRVEEKNGWSAEQLLKELRSDAMKLMHTPAPPDMALPGEISPTVSALLHKSTDRLSPLVRQRFAYIAPFAPRPATFELEDLAAVWQISREEARETVDTLVDRGLLEPLGGGEFQIHQIMVHHAKLLLGELD